ncbi:MAG: histidinol-phosphate transaminase [Acidothermus cellulolyticus]|nr:histidinol-phosphate transaminase [Acidothermus cellulolyticus]
MTTREISDSAPRPGARPFPRADLRGIPTYKPGRRPATGRRAYKLSSNESPYPPLPSVLDAIAQASDTIHRYPDLLSSDLVAAIAHRFGVPESHVVVGCGSVGLATQIVQAFAGPGDEVAYAWRSFEAYPIIVQVAGAVSIQVPLRPDGVHDLPRLAASITPKTRVVFICNPNNPTGTVVGADALLRFLDAVPAGCLVVLDEAYREFVTNPDSPDGIALYRDRPNVVVLRTFSKAYGLAGLRVGYAIAQPEIVDAIRITDVPFSTNALGQAAALASLQPAAEAELMARVQATISERERIVAALRAAGWDIPPPEGNFVWLPTGDRTESFAAACEAAGVIVRPFAGEGVRVTIGEPEANTLFLDVARAHGPAPTAPTAHGAAQPSPSGPDEPA